MSDAVTEPNWEGVWAAVPEPKWDDVWAAIGREVWKLAPEDHQESGHRDLKFLTCWQNIMEAVDNGIASCYPESANDIEATGRCCCAGCVGMGPCERDDEARS